jgi:hypothetical protein
MPHSLRAPEALIVKKKDSLDFFSLSFMYYIQHCFICRPSDSTVSEDARMNPGQLRLYGIDCQTWLDLIP